MGFDSFSGGFVFLGVLFFGIFFVILFLLFFGGGRGRSNGWSDEVVDGVVTGWQAQPIENNGLIN